MPCKKSISGFLELLPAEQILFDRVMAVIRRHYEMVGAVPLETPAVETLDTLLAKGGINKEIYAVNRVAGESSEAKLGLRFDLTVPLARYVVQNRNDLTFPFRRYQTQPVWRGERPQAGRYRQFYQCDIDIIGDENLSLIADAEMPAVIIGIFDELEIGEFEVLINNRKIMEGMLEHFGVAAEHKAAVIKIIDGLDKIGAQATRRDLEQIGLENDAVSQLIQFFQADMPNADLLANLKTHDFGEKYHTGVKELQHVIGHMQTLGVPDNRYRIDLGIARGLDYYTGTVYETRLLKHSNIGSICSGGRYDHLLEQLGANRSLPGVGISIGLSRLLPKLIDAGVLVPGGATKAPVLVTVMDEGSLPEYLAIGSELRFAGVGAEVFTEQRKLGAQMKYAHRKGFEFAILANKQELSQGVVQVRHLRTGAQIVIERKQIVSWIKDGHAPVPDLVA